jgi:hypothetical protein
MKVVRTAHISEKDHSLKNKENKKKRNMTKQQLKKKINFIKDNIKYLIKSFAT